MRPLTQHIDVSIDINLKELIALIALLRWSSTRIRDPDLPKLHEKLTTLLTEVGIMHESEESLV